MFSIPELASHFVSEAGTRVAAMVGVITVIKYAIKMLKSGSKDIPSYARKDRSGEDCDDAYERMRGRNAWK